VIEQAANLTRIFDGAPDAFGLKAAGVRWKITENRVGVSVQLQCNIAIDTGVHGLAGMSQQSTTEMCLCYLRTVVPRDHSTVGSATVIGFGISSACDHKARIGIGLISSGNPCACRDVPRRVLGVLRVRRAPDEQRADAAAGALPDAVRRHRGVAVPAVHGAGGGRLDRHPQLQLEQAHRRDAVRGSVSCCVTGCQDVHALCSLSWSGASSCDQTLSATVMLLPM